MSTFMTPEAYRSWYGQDLSPDIAYLFHDNYNPRWTPVYKADLKAKKIEKQRRQLRNKRRDHNPVAVQPCFIWVFFCEGINKFFYRGWYLYIKTMQNEYSSTPDLLTSIRSQIPMGMLPLSGMDEAWKREFYQAYKKNGRKRKEAFYPGWCLVQSPGPSGKVLEFALQKKMLERDTKTSN